MFLILSALCFQPEERRRAARNRLSPPPSAHSLFLFDEPSSPPIHAADYRYAFMCLNAADCSLKDLNRNASGTNRNDSGTVHSHTVRLSRLSESSCS